MSRYYFLKKYWPVVVLLVLSFATHFAFRAHPKQAVFDEVYFTSFVSSYLTNTYYFDIHPPFSKLLILGFGKLAGISPLESPLTIGDPLPDSSWQLVRMVPLFAGILLPLIIFYIGKKLKMSTAVAFSAGMFIILENSLLVQSRFILLDSLLLFFGFLGLLLYLHGREKGSSAFKVASIVSLALCLSVKWTGASFIGIAFLVELYDFIKSFIQNRPNFGIKKRAAKIATWVALFGVLPLAIYASFFAIHFDLLYKSGTGDAFMSPVFQKTLEGNSHQHDAELRNTSFIEKFLELNIVMYDSNARLDAPHDYGSAWYTWPLELRSIFYWESVSETNDVRSFIYYLGNPVIYLFAFLSIVILALTLIFQKITRRILIRNVPVGIFLLVAYFVNLLPFISIHRVMFLYHYEAALVFGILALAFLLDQLPLRYKKTITCSVIVLALASFIYFSPLTYGLPVNDADHSRYFLLQGWR